MEDVVSLLGRDSGDLAALGELAGDSEGPTCGPMGVCCAAVRGAALTAGFVALVLCKAELPL